MKIISALVLAIMLLAFGFVLEEDKASLIKTLSMASVFYFIGFVFGRFAGFVCGRSIIETKTKEI